MLSCFGFFFNDTAYLQLAHHDNSIFTLTDSVLTQYLLRSLVVL